MILLPTYPGPRSAVPRVLDFGGFLEPPSGAEVTRINRLGNRYAVAFDMPPLENAGDGRIWANRLVRGMKEPVRMEYPLIDFDPGAPGAFVVDGAEQAGTSLNVRGGTPQYMFQEGQPFSLIIAGRSYLDFIAEQTIADASGRATITLTQMLRASPADGDPLNFSQPIIEGYVMGDTTSWELAVERVVGISFDIVEAR